MFSWIQTFFLEWHDSVRFRRLRLIRIRSDDAILLLQNWKSRVYLSISPEIASYTQFSQWVACIRKTWSKYKSKPFISVCVSEIAFHFIKSTAVTVISSFHSRKARKIASHLQIFALQPSHSGVFTRIWCAVHFSIWKSSNFGSQ